MPHGVGEPRDHLCWGACRSALHRTFRVSLGRTPSHRPTVSGDNPRRPGGQLEVRDVHRRLLQRHGPGRLAAHDRVLGCRHRRHRVGGHPTVPQGIHRWSVAGCPATTSGHPRLSWTSGRPATRSIPRRTSLPRGNSRAPVSGKGPRPPLLHQPRARPAGTCPAAAARNRHRRDTWLVLCSAIGDRRQPNGEHRAVAKTCAARGDGAAVRLDEGLGDGQADAGAAVAPVAGGVDPVEAVEDMWRCSAGMPSPLSATVNSHLAVGVAAGQRDACRRRRCGAGRCRAGCPAPGRSGPGRPQDAGVRVAPRDRCTPLARERSRRGRGGATSSRPGPRTVGLRSSRPPRRGRPRRCPRPAGAVGGCCPRMTPSGLLRRRARRRPRGLEVGVEGGQRGAHLVGQVGQHPSSGGLGRRAGGPVR